MKKKIKNIIGFIFFGKTYSFLKNADPFTLIVNKIFQLVFRINANCHENIHFTTTIGFFGKINYQRDQNTLTSFAVSGGCYIQAINGIEIGKNFLFAPGVKIISANHNPKNHDQWIEAPPIKIGDDVWLGANVIILPSVEIANNCIIGAGSVVTKSILQDGTVAIGNPARGLKKNMKILTIIGARPQFIKAATVSRVIQNTAEIREILLHTGQHFDDNMSKIFFDELEIPIPNYNLGIGGGNHGEQTGKMLQKVEEVLLKEKPDLVMIYGDTNSTLAGSLAAVKLHIPVAHVEAGLRSFNKKMPEEINRILTDHSSDILFTPTSTAIKNLQNEGVDKNKIENVGDVMYDASIFYGKKAEKRSSLLSVLELNEKEYILTTIHRAENTDDLNKLKNVFLSLEKIANDYNMVLPIHPRTKKTLESINYSFDNSNIKFINPVGYLDMVMLEKYSKMIITDSGGVQKEAYFHKVPCVTLRDETEWIELIERGWNFLADSENLLSVIQKAINIKFSKDDNIYGKGDASFKIVNRLLECQKS